jgi:hypothetical protein
MRTYLDAVVDCGNWRVVSYLKTNIRSMIDKLQNLNKILGTIQEKKIEKILVHEKKEMHAMWHLICQSSTQIKTQQF